MAASFRLDWRVCTVAGRQAAYATAGSGRPVVFLHGWALSHHSYEPALRQIVREGISVYAPALPGFGGTAELPHEETSLAGYARWLKEFLTVAGIEAPVTLVGHSFGGAVAIQTAHDWPAAVARLVLVNPVGAPALPRTGSVASMIRQLPLWDWSVHLPADLLPGAHLSGIVSVIFADALPNLVRHPLLTWRVGNLARSADLTDQLESLKQRSLPVVVVWGKRDIIVRLACVESLQAALGEPQLITVAGSHNWLLADPDGFGEIITRIVGAVP